MTEIPALSNLTTGQFRIWAGQKLDPDCPLYNMALAFHIQGPLRSDLFRAAFQKLIDRSDALRTVISENDGIPHQFVHARLDYPLVVKDLSRDSDPLETARTMIKSQSMQPFDLGMPLFDSLLLKIAVDEHIWYLNQHHLITDGWSCANLYQQMSAFYQLALKGQLERAPELPQYQDYRRYEQTFVQTKQYTKAARYWEAQRSIPAMPMELYGKLPSTRAMESKRHFCDLGPERSEALRKRAMDADFRSLSVDLSLFNLFAALLNAFLFRISGNTELVIGTPSHHRPTATFKATIGLFMELFPLHIAIPPKATFRSLIKALIPQSYDFLKYALPGTGGIQSGSNYAVVLNYINARFSDFGGMPMRSTWVHPDHVDRGHAFRLQVQDFDRSGSIQLHFDLSRPLFDPELSHKAMRHFIKLVDAFVRNPDQLIEAVDLTSPDEKSAIARCNQTRVDRPPNRTVVSLFSEQVDATPDAEAIIEDGQTTTYRQIDRRSNRMAQRLRSAGVSSGSMVAVFLERSRDLVIALLGILKAGATFVPIDASFPLKRIIYVLDDCKASLVLTHNSLQHLLPASGPTIISLDGAWRGIDDDGKERPSLPPGENDLAYLIYTSGSTGQPKGVMIEHGSLANYLLWARNQYMNDGPHDLALFSTIAADLTMTSIFLPLISGGRIRVYREGSQDVDLSIMDVFQEDAVDIIKLTPSHLSMLAGQHFRSRRLKKLIVGGEDFKTGLARQIYGWFDGRIEIFNEYGPTEATVGCMIHRFDPTADTRRSVAIGHPIDNTRIYLLDAGLNPVPIGVTGEIYIAGKGLARGYWNRRDLTQTVFFPDPFQKGERMYASGDLGRWKSEGVLEFLGRRDHQVKLRGFRIELGEIESALTALPGIQASFAQVVDHQSGASPHDHRHCIRCGLSSNHPRAKLDDQSICRICRDFEQLKDVAHLYFKTEADLIQVIDHAKRIRRGPYDGLMQYSGGKDSTYALYKLVEMGLHPLVFSFDNGFISNDAKANIQRVVDDLQLDLVWGRTPAMNEIFVDSLRRFSNVCNGCQKAINTLSVNLAREKGMGYIFTGLSRGQFFDTRVSELFRNQIIDRQKIDWAIIEARKAYHRMDDAVAQHLDVSAFAEDAVFEEIQFVDFYRYTDVTLPDMLTFLEKQASWTRPRDTGRSTNCLINEAGIYIHQKERGFHNYELPYSWDVRLGHKSRESALDELNDDIDKARVKKMLQMIRYDPDEKAFSASDRRIIAYYVADKAYAIDDLRRQLAKFLPGYMIPTHFFHMTSFPLNPTGKIDQSALPLLRRDRQTLPSDYVAPRNDAERTLADVWAKVLGTNRVGIHDNYFDLGGDSILSIQIVALAGNHGLEFTPGVVFQYPTVADLALHLSDSAEGIRNAQTDPKAKKRTTVSEFSLANLDAEQLASISKQLE